MNNYTRIDNPIRPAPGALLPVSGNTVWGVLKEVRGAHFTDFPLPTIILIGRLPENFAELDANDEDFRRTFNPVLRDKWNDELPEGSVIVEMPVVTGLLEIILIALVVAAVVAAVVIAATLKKPTIPSGSSDSAGTVHNLSGQSNKNKLGSPIEVAYGRCRLWPSYAAPSYTIYTDNNQYLYLLLCLGQGEFDIESIKIENTEIASYPEVEYAIIAPNATIPGWLYTHVHTVREINNVEMLAPNDADYPGGRIDNGVTVPAGLPGAAGWVGPFTVSPAKVKTTAIALDITFPNGLYVQNTDTSELLPNSATAQFEYRPTSAISGGAESGWLALGTFAYTSVIVTGQPLNTPLRFTLNYSLPEGEYQVRCRRATRKQDSSTAQSQMNWEGMRSYLTPNQTSFGNVTLLAVKIRATNSLNGDVSDRINVTATRKLPTYNATTGLWDDTTLVASRSIVMAYCDVLRNKVYGCGIADEFLDMVGMLAIQAHHTSIDYAFDFVFDQKRSAWEALGIVAKAGRCLPTLNGSRVSMVLDQLTEVPLHVFTPDNIIRGSFQWQLKIANYQEYDGLMVTYTDEDTFNQETLLCTAPGEDGSNPDQVTLDGITKREQAWHEGLYLRYLTRYMRQNLVFNTGLEGYIPTLGDMIGVSFDVPSWGQSGKVLEVQDMVTYTLVTLSSDLDFSVVVDGDPLKISFRTGTMGQPTTPYSIIKHEDEASQPGVYRVTPVIDPTEFYLDGDRENTIYAAGAPNEQFVLAKITAVMPQDDVSVQITSAVFDERVFDGDLIPAPDPTPPPPEDTFITITLRGGYPFDPGIPTPPGAPEPMFIIYSVDDPTLCSGYDEGTVGAPPSGPDPRPAYWPSARGQSSTPPFGGALSEGGTTYTVDTINEKDMRAALGLSGAIFTPLKFNVQAAIATSGGYAPWYGSSPFRIEVRHSDGRVLVRDIPVTAVLSDTATESPWSTANLFQLTVPPTGAGDIAFAPAPAAPTYATYPRAGYWGYPGVIEGVYPILPPVDDTPPIITIEITDRAAAPTMSTPRLARVVWSLDSMIHPAIPVIQVGGTGASASYGPYPRPAYWPAYTRHTDSDGTGKETTTTVNVINEAQMRSALSLPSDDLNFRIQLGYRWINHAVTGNEAHVKITHSDGRVLEFDVTGIPDIASTTNPWGGGTAAFRQFVVPATGGGPIRQVDVTGFSTFSAYTLAGES